MAETANYGLYLNDTSQEKFKSWRDKMNGNNDDSNIARIDAILGDKADHCQYILNILAASAWSGEEGNFTQTISVDELGKTQNGLIGLSPSASTEQRQAAANADLSIVEQADGSVIIRASAEVPQIDLPISFILFR